MNTHQHHVKTCTGRRTWLALMGLVGINYLSGCKAQDRGAPKPPYGKALDVTQANTFVEFDFRIDKADRYDVVLEVFDKVIKETGPLPDVSNAHFKVRIESLAPSGEVILEQEVNNKKGLSGRTYVGPSQTEKTDLMKFTNYLVKELPLSANTYRIHCDNLNLIPDLEGRLVKVSILHKVVYK